MMNMLTCVKKAVTYHRMPFGIPSKYGKLYGWTLHDWRHPPEMETVTFFEKHLTKDDIVIDVGANIGYYTLLFSKLAKEVVAFEPSPAYAYLSRAVNERKNVTLEQKGVWETHTWMNLHADSAGSGLGSVVYKDGTIVNEIELIPLKEYPKEFTWMKIDVEGAEIHVLRGLRSPCKIVIEAAGIMPHTAEVGDMGYSIYAIMDDGIVPFNGTYKNNLYLEPTRI